MTDVPVRTSLQHLVASSLSPAEFDAMRARAYHERRTVVVNLDEITDPILKGWLQKWAATKFGRRMRR